MKAVIFCGLMSFIVVVVSAQTASLPTVILDSLIYETKKGRACELVTKAQLQEIEAMGKELAHTNVALKLSEDKSYTLSSLLGNARESQNIDFQQYALDKKKLRQKIKKRTIVILGQTVLIIILLI